MLDLRYDKLDKSVDYDHDAAEQLAEAMAEIRDLESRASYLKELVKENKKLHPFIWITADGEIKAHHQIDDDHFKNILSHLVATGRRISKELKWEARRRNIIVPTERNIPRIALIEAETVDDFTDQEDNY